MTKQRKKTKPPLVSVVMSVYNGSEYVGDAIESILNQTFNNFEFIIINDGSTDGTLKIIKGYKDPRIVLVSRENKGLVASLNEGISVAKGKYIARQDDDDMSLPERLRAQIDLLEKDEALGLVGSSIQVIDHTGKYLYTHRVLLGGQDISLELPIRSPFAHGSTMYRRSVYCETKGYREQFWPAEDYDLWCQMAQLANMANIDSPLYAYRVNPGGISAQNTDNQELRADEVREKLRGSTRPSKVSSLEAVRSLEQYLSIIDRDGAKRLVRYLKVLLRSPAISCASRLSVFYRVLLTTNLYKYPILYYKRKLEQKRGKS